MERSRKGEQVEATVIELLPNAAWRVELDSRALAVAHAAGGRTAGDGEAAGGEGRIGPVGPAGRAQIEHVAVQSWSLSSSKDRVTSAG